MRGAASKVDRNQKPIVKALEAAGATVTSLATVGNGCPDLMVGFRSANYLMEVKSEDGLLTPKELEFFEKWRGRCTIVFSPEDALREIGAIE
jgi:hypothetical protein